MRKNHSKIVCIKLVHLPYLYMMHGHTYIKILAICLIGYMPGFGIVVVLIVCDPKTELFLRLCDLQFCLLSIFLPVPG